MTAPRVALRFLRLPYSRVSDGRSLTSMAAEFLLPRCSDLLHAHYVRLPMRTEQSRDSSE
jgi:hypothetical protein